MISPTRALQAADGGVLDLESVVAALSARFAVATGSGQLVRRRWLDTFDRRLHAAGLTLEHQILSTRDSPGERLVLSRPDGSSTVAVSGTDLCWPALAEVLPPGPVRDVVAPVSGIRALMVASSERRRMQRLELRNGDGKTVARVELDEPATPVRVPADLASSPSTASRTSMTVAPARLTVLRLRGYDQEAQRADRLLVGIGLRPVERGDVTPCWARTTSRTHHTHRPDRSIPAQELLTMALGDFLTTMRENLPGLLDDVDTEFLHDFRVAVRRTRATLKLGRPALPGVMRTRWEPAFKRLGDLTTPVRDLDVYELGLPVMSRWLVTADRTDLDPLAAHLRRTRTVARLSLVRSLRSAAFRRLVTGWDDDLAGLAGLPHQGLPGGGDEVGQLSAGRLADQSISRAYRRVARDGGLIGADSPAADLHELRKRCKELRYALDVFAPLVNPAARKRAVTDLKGLQDVLGRFQDSEVQRLALRGFAEEMMAQGTTAGAMLAMGELIGHLDVDQDRARCEFDLAFARFGRPSSLTLMHRLGGGR